jgi:hypothetical protein
MSRVEEIERAIQELSREEFAQIALRIQALEQERPEANWIGTPAAASSTS